jgi:hypothetical protein
MLTVMSGMDPHMISEIWDGFLLSLWMGCVEVGLLGCGLVIVRLDGAIEIVIFLEDEFVTLLEYLRHSC